MLRCRWLEDNGDSLKKGGRKPLADKQIAEEHLGPNEVEDMVWDRNSGW